MDTKSSPRRGTSSLYEDQLLKGFRFLQFDDFLETEFRDFYQRQNFKNSRLVLCLCGVVVLTVLLFKLFISGPASNPTELAGLGVMAVIIFCAVGVSYMGTRRFYQLLLWFSVLIVGLAGAVVDVEASMAGKSYYFAGQVGWLFVVWSMFGLLFGMAALTAVLISSIYLISAATVGFATEQLLFEGFMLLHINLLGGYSCYRIEYGARRSFLDSRMLNQLAERDGLTGLYNRRAFDEYMERIWRQSQRDMQPITIIMIDIDHFKIYNDRYGHQAGDDALKSVANVVAGGMQRPLDLAARFGGEEFALVLYGPATDYVMDLPEILLAEVQNLNIPHKGNPDAKCLSVSIGVAVVTPEGDRSMAGAIQIADEALYQAKHEGRNRVIIRMSGTTVIETGRFRAGSAIRKVAG